jgi:hypothetical protein
MRADVVLSAPLDPANTHTLAYDSGQRRQMPLGSPDVSRIGLLQRLITELEAVTNWLRQ